MKSFLIEFKNNRRAYWSLLFFLMIFVITLFAELVANDKPLIVKYNDSLYFPVFKQYSETTFGGDFETEANYRDDYIAQKIDSNGFMIWPPIRFNYSTINYDLRTPAPSSPDFTNLLGTDDQGRDVLARLIYGLRISILFGLALTIISAVVGVIAGAIQGYFGGITDIVFQRFMEIWSGLPILYLLIILASIIEPSFWWLLLLLALFSWMSIAEVVRTEFFRVRNFDYVKAARVLGASEFSIMFRHILPNAFVAALTFIPFLLNSSITALTSLDFLGFGLPAGSASLGELLAQGKNNLHAPWLGMAGFFSIAIILSLLIFIGEGVRDALDPRRRGIRK